MNSVAPSFKQQGSVQGFVCIVEQEVEAMQLGISMKKHKRKYIKAPEATDLLGVPLNLTQRPYINFQHKIGLHGAVGLLTKRGSICTECGKIIRRKKRV